MEPLDDFRGDGIVADVDAHIMSDTPVEVLVDLGLNEKLQVDVGIVGTDIFEARFHGGEDHAAVAHAGRVDESDQGRDARAVVAVDAGGPFEFDQRTDAVLAADAQHVAEGGEPPGVSAAPARLHECVAPELGEGGCGHGVSPSETPGRIVVTEDECAVGGHFNIAFEEGISAAGACLEGLDRAFDSDIAAAVADNHGARRGQGGQRACQGKYYQRFFHGKVLFSAKV